MTEPRRWSFARRRSEIKEEPGEIPKNSPNPTAEPQKRTRSLSRRRSEVKPEPIVEIPKNFPQFKGRVVHRPTVVQFDDEYSNAAYQYATSSYPSNTQPAAIVFAEDDSDIILAIAWAKETGTALAIRSGGHQYLGFSSTSGANIQLDMSKFREFSVDPVKQTLSYGVGYRNFEIYDLCKEVQSADGRKGVIFPHGECSNVAMGGHVQTGGYSVILRSFGLFIDYIEDFDIILSVDQAKRTVTKPNPSKPEQDNDDLWFSVLGGSPGNIGVLTRITSRFLWDSDFPDSHGEFRVFLVDGTLVTMELVTAALRLLEEFNDDEECPPEWNYTVLLASPQHQRFLDNPTIDQFMCDHHRDLYGPRGEEWRVQMHPFPLIAISAVWCDIFGQRDYATRGKPFFKRIENMLKPWKLAPCARLLKHKDAHPLSFLTATFEWKNAREFDMPVVKRYFISETQDLSKRGFAEWATQCCKDILDAKGCKVGAQWAFHGGKHSRLIKNVEGNFRTAVGHRSSTLYCAMDSFYQSHHLAPFTDNPSNAKPWPEPKAWSNAYMRKLESEAYGPSGKCGDRDLRLIWAPNYKTEVLDHQRASYFDTEEAYQRVLATKRRFDPDFIFSANTFGVGATARYGLHPGEPIPPRAAP